jgi:hypothetical protein
MDVLSASFFSTDENRRRKARSFTIDLILVQFQNTFYAFKMLCEPVMV